MKILSNAAYDELLRDSEQGRTVKALEKAHKKELEKVRKRHNEYAEDLREDHSEALHTKNREIEKLQNRLDNLQEEYDDSFDERVEEFEKEQSKKTIKLEAQVAELTEKNKILEDKVKKNGELFARELKLDEQENGFASWEESLDRQTKELEQDRKALADEKKQVETDQYNKGYTDGVADTLRESDGRTSEANERVYKLADKALSKETTIIATTTPATKKK